MSGADAPGAAHPEDAAPPGATRRSFRVWLAATALMLLALGALLPGLEVETDVLAMLPAAQRDPAAEAATARMTQAFSRQLLVLVGGTAELAPARAGAAAYAEVLRRSGLFAQVQLEPDASLLAPTPAERAQRHGLLAPADRALLQADGTTAGGEALRQQALAELYSPGGLARLTRVADDPLGLHDRFLRQSLVAPGRASLEAGVLVARDAQGLPWVLVTATLRDAPFAWRLQGSLTETLAQARTAAQAGGVSTDDAATTPRVLVSGVAPHALHAASRAKAEMSELGGVATALTLLLLWSVFGTLRPVALSLLCMALGVAGGVLACRLVFGSVHLMTLVFGSSLVGIAVDYALHFLCDEFRKPGTWRGPDAWPQVGRGLTLGLVCSALGYLAFATAPLPVLRQMAVFSIAGLAVAYAAVRWGFPALAKPSPLGRGARAWMRTADRFLKPRRLHWSFWLMLALLGAVGLHRLRFVDDLRLLQAVNPALFAEGNALRERLGTVGERQFFLVTGATPEAVLQAEESLTERLEALRARGALAGWQAFSRALPSQRRQAENRALAAALYAPAGAATAQLAELGLPPATAAAESAAFANAAVPLAPDTALRTLPRLAPLAPLWLGEVAGRHASLVALFGVADEPALRAAAAGLSANGASVTWTDPVETITDTLRAQRETAQWRMLGVYALTVLVLLAAYGWRRAPRFVFPSLAGAALTLATLGWLGVPANLFTMLALLLVLGMGIDYAIFLRDTSNAPISSRLGITLAALTNLFSFGALAFSGTPFLRAIGLTLGLGIAISMALALLTAEAAQPAGSKASPDAGPDVADAR